jgi:4-amino-4-deoxy-L-arabinose transferase-like glycosyltransferase
MSNPAPDWKKISIALVLLVLVRGVFLLSVLPPFEGWDEYQHIAYIVYLRENRALPSYGVSKVPHSMAEMLRRYPHSDWDYQQSLGWGTMKYDTFWTQTQKPTIDDQSPIQLYEAQQGPLYYVVALPFWIAFSSLGDLAGIYALRLLNVLFLAAAVFIFLQMLAKCIPNLRHKLIIGLLVATYPLYLITAARVTDCALSILFGSLTLYFVISALKEKPLRHLTLATCCLGLGILAKATMFTMIPVVFAGVPICAYRRQLSGRTLLKALAACVGLMLIVLAPLLYRNYMTSGGFYLMSQHRDLRGKSALWVWAHFFRVGWSTQVRQWLFTRDLWVSGWTFIPTPDWIDFPYKAFMYLFWFIVIGKGLKRGLGKQLPSRRLEYLFSDNADLLIFGLVVICMTVGLGYFATLSLAVYGVALTIPSYFMIALPAWTTLLYQAAVFLGTRVSLWFSRILLAFYLGSELVGTLYVMPRIYTATAWSLLSWNRLLQIHPFFPSPWFIVPSLLLIVGLLIYLLRVLWRVESSTSSLAEASAG